MPSFSMDLFELEQKTTCGFAAKAIRQKTRQIVRMSGFHLYEQEDIEQELRLQLLQRITKFNPAIAHWNVFVRTIIERRAATLIMQRCNKMRQLPDEALEQKTEPTHIDLTLDMAEILERMPRHLRALCERLKKASLTEVAIQLGIPRTTLRYRIEALRAWFSDANSKNSPPLCRRDG